MEKILGPSEILHRYAVLLAKLSGQTYPLSVTVAVDSTDPLRLDAQNGKPIKECGLIISDADSWNGDLVATVRIRDLQLDEDHLWSLTPLLDERPGGVVDLLGDAILWSHLEDFEEFSTHIAPLVCERECLNAIHRHYGLILEPQDGNELAALRFQFHASAIAAAVNQRLLRAAEQGAVE